MGREKRSVLVVEDEKLLNWSLASSLSRWGYEVQTVFTGEEAVARIDTSVFQVVLLDYRLPDLDGIEVAKLIRKRQPGAAIFLLTAFQLSELTLEAGLIDGYFNKPLDLQQLHRALQEIPMLRKSEKKVRLRATSPKRHLTLP
jgi:CheY-like chemotaxis protein